MTKTKFTGVYYRDNLKGDRVFYIQYKQGNKLKRQKVGTKAEGITPLYCKKFRDLTLVKLRLGEHAPIKDRGQVKTLNEISEEFFESGGKKGILRSKTKLQSLYKHLSHLGNEPLTYFDDDAFLTLTRKKSKEISKKTKRVLSAQTVNNILTLLSAILHFAEKKKYTSEVPEITKPVVDNRRERYLEKEEIKALYKEIENSNIKTKDRVLLFTKLALTTGGRLNSILTIRGKDIKRSRKIITLKNHKSNTTYDAFIPQELMDLIPQLEPREKLIDVADAKQIQRPLQGILNDLFNVGLNADDRKDRVVIHTLRHTFASHLAINGTSIHKIMRLMDHKDIEMTLRYAKLMPDSGRDDVANLYG